MEKESNTFEWIKSSHPNLWSSIILNSKQQLLLDLQKKCKFKYKSIDIDAAISNNVYSFIYLESQKRIILLGSTIGKSNTKHINNRAVFQITDMHAEMLALKILEKSFLEHASLIISNKISEKNTFLRFSKKKKKFELKKSHKIVLFISQVPCGDSSIRQKIEVNNSFPKTWPIDLAKITIDNSEKSISNLIKQKPNFYSILIMKKGVIRTKPFRKDLPSDKISTEISCSDKLMYASVLGVNTPFLNQLFQPIYIDKILLPKTNFLFVQGVTNGIDFRKRYLCDKSEKIKSKYFTKESTFIKIAKKNLIKHSIKKPEIVKVDFIKAEYNLKQKIKFFENIVYINKIKNAKFGLDCIIEELDPKSGMLKGANIKSKKANWEKISSKFSNFHIRESKKNKEFLKIIQFRKERLLQFLNNFEILGQNFKDEFFCFLSIRSYLIFKEMERIVTAIDSKKISF